MGGVMVADEELVTDSETATNPYLRFLGVWGLLFVLVLRFLLLLLPSWQGRWGHDGRRDHR